MLSFFIALFASALSKNPWSPILLSLYLTLALIWLICKFWQYSCEMATIQRARRRPWGVLSAFIALPLITLIVLTDIGRTIAYQMQGFIHSSGGTSGGHELALDGVGDGANSVSGKNASSTGFADEDIFMESQEDSLYDVMSEIYGEPRTGKEINKAIALRPQDVAFIKNHGVAPKSERASRTFQLQRSTPTRRYQLKSQPADALLYVEGLTPLHIRLATYAQFDGTQWQEEQPYYRSLSIQLKSDGWMMLSIPHWIQELSQPVTHEIKIGQYVSQRLPTINNLAGFRIGRVNQPNWFSWAQDGLLHMIRPLPSGNSIEQRTHLLRFSDLPVPQISKAPEKDIYRRIEVCHHNHGDWRVLARQWVTDLPEGWPQINTVIERLRSHAQLDPDFVLPDDCPDPIAHFLFQSHRGPDYLFAGSAVMMLRSLGYPARLISGFYARPEDYDLRSDQTPIHADDIHFWIEIRLPDFSWVTLEPTPGYYLLQPLPSFTERLAMLSKQSMQWLLTHRWLNGTGLLLSLLIWYFRIELRNLMASRYWKWRVESDPRRIVIATLRLLLQRAQWVGCPKPAHLSLACWFDESASATLLIPRELLVFRQLAECALYDSFPRIDIHQTRKLCEAALVSGSLKFWRSHPALHHNE
ncbi:MAG: hypothetical protein HJJLKODD_00159 [Phycisphaerae bacterium]|nr:hypothetical protein [Phycisphaerae bacterium]